MTAVACETNEGLGHYQPYPDYLDAGIECLVEATELELSSLCSLGLKSKFVS